MYLYIELGVSESLLFNANSAIFAAISWREQANFQRDDDEVRFVLDQHALLCCLFFFDIRIPIGIFKLFL